MTVDASESDLGEAVPERGLRVAVRAFKHRDFALFWSSALVSSTGTWVQNTTVPYVVYDLTGSKSLIGITAFLNMFPTVLVGPLAGSLADRFPRRKVLLVTQIAQSVVAATLWLVWLSGRDSVPALLVLVTLAAAASGMNIPAQQAYVTELVPKRDLLNAITLNSAQFNAARAIGPAIAGVTLATLGAAWGFFLNAVSFLAVIVALLFVRTADVHRDRPEGNVRQQFAEGWRFVREKREILLCMAVVVLVAGLGMPVAQLMPVFAADVLHVGKSGYGLLASALGIGGIVATPIIGGWGDAVRRSRLVGFGLLLYGLVLLGFANAPSLPVAVVCVGVAGACFLAIISSLNTTVQLLVDERLRGRIMAIYVMSFTAAYPVGSLLQGAVADHIGAPATTSSAAIALLGVTIWVRTTKVFERLD
jgi:predicted MFS family arabinose efflux permease